MFAKKVCNDTRSHRLLPTFYECDLNLLHRIRLPPTAILNWRGRWRRAHHPLQAIFAELDPAAMLGYAAELVRRTTNELLEQILRPSTHPRVDAIEVGEAIES